jgi:hypothetical protein
MQLVDNARKAWRWFSVQAMALAAAGQIAWMNIPADLKASVPPNLVTYGTVVLLVLGIVGRLVAQPKAGVK